MVLNAEVFYNRVKGKGAELPYIKRKKMRKKQLKITNDFIYKSKSELPFISSRTL